MMRGCPLLEDVHFLGPPGTDAALRCVAQGCPRLRTLELDYCASITTASLVAIAERCPLLESIRYQSVAHANSAAVEAIGRGCPRLETLTIWCGMMVGSLPVVVNESAWLAVANGCPLLRDLSIIESDGVTDTVLRALERGTPRLDHLYLIGCHEISDFEPLARLPLLTSLSFSRCIFYQWQLKQIDEIRRDAGLAAVEWDCEDVMSDEDED